MSEDGEERGSKPYFCHAVPTKRIEGKRKGESKEHLL